jgi:molybdate/tungstate transport system ATP-binding protein
MIILENINLSLPDFRLKNICLDIQKNDFFALIGPTGSGKSLLLEAMTGLLPIDKGKIFLENKDITNLAVEKRNLALVYQDFALFPHLNVTKNILYGIRYHNIPKKTAMQRFDMLINTLGLEKITKRSPLNLSGGEKQRISLARSLILNPDVLLLDEPLSALDPIFHEEAKELLKKIHQELGITIIMVSHNFPDVLYLANRAAIIKNGQIMQKGLTKDIFEKPNSIFTANFVGMKNIFPLKTTNGKLLIEDKDKYIEILAHNKIKTDHTHIGIRPEDISFVKNKSDLKNNKYTNIFQGKIDKISNSGIYLSLLVTSGHTKFNIIWPRSYMREYKLDIGQNINFRFPPEIVHTF